MKIYSLIACFFLFVFAKCKKDENDTGGQYYGYAKATINGNWVNYNKARGAYFHNNPDSINIILERWDGLIAKETIGFGPLTKTLQIQQRINKATFGGMTLTSLYATLSDDGDVLCDVYYIYEADSLQNFITITSFDTQTKEIRGIFQATYLIDPSRIKCRQSAPDTLRIKNGEFYTKVF